ncbi:MAG: hypothetical protein DCC67_10340 [Planctomycetota bacterium]|nr:MAG: hypothetical protein DCC67_10340 [Planctomycetota bacterium]
MWQQRFWVLSVVGTLAAVICWTMAASKLDAEFTANTATIKGKFGEISTIQQKSVHGNEAVNAMERAEADKIAKAVRDLWQRLYDYQRESVLKWPEELGKDFVQYIETLKFDAPIEAKWRDRYLNYIKTQFDALVEIVDAQKMRDDTAAMGGPGEGRGGEGYMPPMGLDPSMPAEDFTVVWADQGKVRQKLTLPSQVTSRQIWVTQEDLWVYRTLLGVIHNTNAEKKATRIDNAAIKVIQSLEVGPEAAAAMAAESVILMPAGTADGGEGGIEALGGEALRMGRPGGEGYGDPSLGAESIDATLLMNRYVNEEGKPITDGATTPTGEYRRLPVRMVLMMDQKWIPRVLIECANAALPIEVQRLKINAAKSGVDKTGQAFDMPGAPSGGGGVGGSMYGRGEYGGAGMGRPIGMEGGYGRGGYGGGYGGESMSVPLTDLERLGAMATVEVQGLVYIYNVPDDAALGGSGGDAAAGSEELAAAP